ncbi:MAG: MFS transporter [Bacteroidota bacterium]
MILPTLVSAIVVVIAPPKAITHTEKPYKVSLESKFVYQFLFFFKRTNWYRIVVFIFLFKTVSVAIDTMIIPLSIEQGLSRLCIAKYIKFWGTISLLVGNLVGGYILYRISISQGLLLWGIAQTLISLFLVFQFVLWHPYPEYFVLLAIIERFCCGIGRITLMVYQSKNCSKENLMADSAILTSFGSYVRIIISVVAGWVVGRVDWVCFFIIIALLSLLILMFISKLLIKARKRSGVSLTSQWGL